MTAGEGSLYEEVLRSLGGQPPAPRPPRPSASVVLWRRTTSEPGDVEVFWVQRSPALSFMGGWHAFPGGGLDRADAATPVLGTPRGLEEAGRRVPQPEGEPRDLGARSRPRAGGLRAARAARRGRHRDRQRDATGLCRTLADSAARSAALRQPVFPARVARERERAAASRRFAGGESAGGEWLRPIEALARWRRRRRAGGARRSSTSSRCWPRTAPSSGLPRLLDAREANLGPDAPHRVSPRSRAAAASDADAAARLDHQRVPARPAARRCWSTRARPFPRRSTISKQPSWRRATALADGLRRSGSPTTTPITSAGWRRCAGVSRCRYAPTTKPRYGWLSAASSSTASSPTARSGPWLGSGQ